MKYNKDMYAKVAELCHEANRGYCAAIGDTSQVPWNEAPGNIKASAVSGIVAVEENPAITAEQQHQKWCEFKVADGWTYGSTKDMTLKTHPCLVPYDLLPQDQRVKDYIFGAVSRAGLRLLGMLGD